MAEHLFNYFRLLGRVRTRLGKDPRYPPQSPLQPFDLENPCYSAEGDACSDCRRDQGHRWSLLHIR